MTSKAIFYFSLTGNTKSLLQQLDDLDTWDIFDLSRIHPENVSFKGYDTILVGTMTLGRGTPPVYFKKLYSKLISIENTKIGLFGSGQAHYGDAFFCGALDVLEDVLKDKNKISFKLKFESYPTPQVIKEFKQSVKELLHTHEIVKI